MNHESSRGYPSSHLPRAKHLRREMTPAEAILWKHIRAKRFAGYKFRRQQPLGPYIADFFCASIKLIVELDGDSHVGQESADALRESELRAMGYRVLRFWNPDVYDDLEMVLDTIWFACDERATGV